MLWRLPSWRPRGVCQLREHRNPLGTRLIRREIPQTLSEPEAEKGLPLPESAPTLPVLPSGLYLRQFTVFTSLPIFLHSLSWLRAGHRSPVRWVDSPGEENRDRGAVNNVPKEKTTCPLDFRPGARVEKVPQLATMQRFLHRPRIGKILPPSLSTTSSMARRKCSTMDRFSYRRAPSCFPSASKLRKSPITTFPS